MKTVLRIFKSTVFFFIFYIIQTFIFGYIYYILVDSNSYSVILKNLLIGREFFVDINNNIILIVFVFQNIISVVAFAVYSSFIFTYILNREPWAYLINNIAIRKRTSEGSENLLTFAIMFVNRGKYKLYDVNCTVTCYYLKNDEGVNAINAEFSLTDSQPSIDNYYRFSFPVKKFPRKFLEDYLDKNKNYNSYIEDHLSIVVYHKINN